MEHEDLDAVIPLRVRVRHMVGAEDRSTATAVHCPRLDRSTAPATCLACSDCGGVAADGLEAHILCAHPAAPSPLGASQRPMRAEVARHMRVDEVMAGVVVCVPGDAPRGQLLELVLERDLSVMVVVDDAGRPIGLVTPARLAQSWLGGTASDLMDPTSFVLREDSTLADAAMLLAYQTVAYIPVVAGDGSIVGLVVAEEVNRRVQRAP